MRVDLEIRIRIKIMKGIFSGTGGLGTGPPYLQKWGDGFASFEDVGNIGFAVLVERGGDTDYYSVNFTDQRKVSRASESLRLNEGGDGLGRDMFDIAATGIKRLHLRRVNIEADDADA